MRRSLIALAALLCLAPAAMAQNTGTRKAPRPELPAQIHDRAAVTLQQFVRGTLRFVALHELGHGLIDVYELPVLGREEDAADRFAAFWMSPGQGSTEDGLDLIGAMEWWLASAEVSPTQRKDLPWWDEHSMDEQRGFQIACLLYGSKPENFDPLAARVGIPAKRRLGCRFEHQQNARSWSILLRGQISEAAAGRLTAPITYEPSLAETKDAAALAKNMKILEEIAALLGQFKATDQIKVVKLAARDCPKPNHVNAFWDPRARELIICYALINEISNVGYTSGFR